MGAGWVLHEVHLYASASGKGRHVERHVDSPCDSAPPCAAPVNTVLPSHVVPSTNPWAVTATDGTWTTSCATTYTYLWEQQCIGGSWTSTGVTSAYIDATNRGDYLRVVVTATSSGGSASATSLPTRLVPTTGCN